ncbi:MAG: hypothetical protein ACRDBT_10500 [Aeromonas sp.]
MTEQVEITTKSQLVVLEPTTAVTLFTEGQGVDALLADIRQQASSLVPDISTTKGRKEIASVAFAIAKTKTYLDGIGKELTDKYKEIPKRIDAHRKLIRDTLDTLKDEVRAPLTAFEDAEKARVAALQDRLNAFTSAMLVMSTLPSAELEHYLQQIDAIAIDESWQELTAQAEIAKAAAALHLGAAIETAKAREAQEAELAALRKQRDDQVRIDRERNIAEQAAAAEARRQDQARIEAEQRELQAKAREEQARRDAEVAELARQQAEARRIADAELAEQRRMQAEIDAKHQAEAAATQAAEQERQRIEQERLAKAQADQQRAADIEHRRTINNAVLASLISVGIEDDSAMALVNLIARGKIEHLTINY